MTQNTTFLLLFSAPILFNYLSSSWFELVVLDGNHLKGPSVAAGLEATEDAESQKD